MSRDPAAAAERIASIAMYRDPPVIAQATREFWACLRDRLRLAGLAQVPQFLDEAAEHDAPWRDPRLLLAQTCGYPLATRLRGQVRLVATPVYDHPGCQGAMGGSFVIVRADAPYATLSDLRGSTAAINDRSSNSGMNLLRHAIAPHAVGGRFFARVIESGGHCASIALVAAGDVDVAAIDCVTFGNLSRFAPETVAGVRILAETAKTLALPFITAAAASDEEVAILQAALMHFARAAEAAPVRDVLGLRGFEIIPPSAYDAVLDLEREAAASGYPALA